MEMGFFFVVVSFSFCLVLWGFFQMEESFINSYFLLTKDKGYSVNNCESNLRDLKLKLKNNLHHLSPLSHPLTKKKTYLIPSVYCASLKKVLYK